MSVRISIDIGCILFDRFFCNLIWKRAIRWIASSLQTLPFFRRCFESITQSSGTFFINNVLVFNDIRIYKKLSAFLSKNQREKLENMPWFSHSPLVCLILRFSFYILYVPHCHMECPKNQWCRAFLFFEVWFFLLYPAKFQIYQFLWSLWKKVS